MNDDKENIPPFIQDYLDKMEYEGYPDFVKLSREYHKEREDYPGKFAEQSTNLNQGNRTFGDKKSLNWNDGLESIDSKYKGMAYDTAKQHGFKGADPNAPTDKDFTQQGEKFNDMIDQAKRRQQEQQHSFGNEIQSREQQRAAFLEKIKQTKEQITQRQKDNQQEI